MGAIKAVGGVIGTVVSTTFLFAIAMVNLIVLRSIYRTFVKVHSGGCYQSAGRNSRPPSLLIFERSRRGHNLRLRWTDRALWVWLSRLWNDWRSALLMVKPETVIGWHRQGFRLYWRWKSRHGDGRPAVSPEVRNLIRQMSHVNPRWGAPRIHGELLKIGIEVCQSRTHLSLGKDAPISRPIQPPAMGRVVEIPQVGGLHHLYTRKAA
jgi:hypothetical protein